VITGSYDDLEGLLAGFGVPSSAAQVHGYLTGLVLPGVEGSIVFLLEGSELAASGQPQLLERLDTLSVEIRKGLEEPEPFDPLLPDDDVALEQRVAELVAWCEGLLSAFAERSPSGSLSAEGSEVVEDIQALAEAGYNGDDEAEEVAYTEVVEFLRVAVSLLFEELRESAPSQAENG